MRPHALDSSLVCLIATLVGCADSRFVVTAPTPTIVSPADGARYRGGDTITFEGRATDPEDGELDASRLEWWAELHHDEHAHPFQPLTSGPSGSVVVPTTGETSANVFLRFHLRATDSDGHATEVTRDVLPRTVRLRFVTDPAGLVVEIDGQPHSTPFAVDAVVGIERTIGASAQDFGSRHYVLGAIDDGGGSPHTIVTPESDTTFTFAFIDVGPANQRPTCVLETPAPATVGMPVTLRAVANDSDGFVAAVTFYDDTTAIGPAVTSPPFEIDWTPTTSGPHELSAKARDDSNAVTTSAVVAIVVASAGSDAQPPTCALTAPAPFASELSGGVALSAVADDDDAVAGVRFQLDGTDLGVEDTTAPFEATLADTAAYASGQHVFRARARDPAGNVSPWSAVVVSFGGSVNVPSGFSLSPLVDTLSSATALAFADDGRAFVCEQGGALRVVQNGSPLAAPFTTFSVDSAGERGLLGVAFDPSFAANGFVYVYYTVPGTPAHNRVSRITANGNVAVAGSELILLELPALSGATNHNGGALHFGADGMLYASVGDNASSANAQSDATVLGKILRLTSSGSIPTDNPFYGTNSGINRAVYAKGLRNPFTFAISASGRMHINDVGQSSYEEVNLGIAGANYGWPSTEGYFDPDAYPAYTNPLFAYDHAGETTSSGTFLHGVAIVGAAFYEPDTVAFPSDYVGDYFFGDFGGGYVARYDLGTAGVSVFARLPHLLVDVATAPDGSIYALGRNELARISAP